MPIELVIRTTGGRERSFPLGASRVVIGRETRCDLRVPLPSVEKEHCEIVVVDGVLELNDLGSATGTFHNGDRVESAVLSPDDVVQVGSARFVVRNTLG